MGQDLKDKKNMTRVFIQRKYRERIVSAFHLNIRIICHDIHTLWLIV
jgi:hypothetical protein